MPDKPRSRRDQKPTAPPARPQFIPRAPVTSAARRVSLRSERQRFLIICEDEQTEPLYFRGFHLPGLVEVEVIGTGRNTQSLVEKAIELREQKTAQAAKHGAEYAYDQFWCVFDHDSFPGEAFNNAIAQAQAADFQVAYSNEAFEIWFLLHFDFHDARLDRQGCRHRLTERLDRRYEKNDPSVYTALESRQEAAIHNAERLLASYVPHNPHRDNPCTTVHRLVKELRTSLMPPSETKSG